MNAVGEEFSLATRHVSVTYSPDRPYHVTLTWPHLRQEIFLPGAVDMLAGEDVTCGLVSASVHRRSSGYEAVWEFRSSIGSKTARLRVGPHRCEYRLELAGSGTLGTVRFFEGLIPHQKHNATVKHLNDDRTTPYETYSTKSPIGFQWVFVPEPNVYHEQLLHPTDMAQIGVTADLTRHGGNFLANPGILAFAISGMASEWVTLGVATQPGRNTFSSYEYHGGPDGFGLSLNYWGCTQVRGRYVSPWLVLLVGRTAEESLQTYVAHLRSSGLTPETPADAHAWWHRPIVSGWGHQCHMADLFRVRSGPGRPVDNAAYLMCTQSHYEAFVRTLQRHDLPWGTLIVDVQWTSRSGSKVVDTGRWPDMPRFVRELHAAGKKVLLWWAPWETDGLPDGD